MMIFKNMFSFGLTFHGYDYLAQSGPKTIFVAIGSVQIVLCLLSIPMCEYCFLHSLIQLKSSLLCYRA